MVGCGAIRREGHVAGLGSLAKSALADGHVKQRGRKRGVRKSVIYSFALSVNQGPDDFSPCWQPNDLKIQIRPVCHN